jgi:hypothetical protein
MRTGICFRCEKVEGYFGAEEAPIRQVDAKVDEFGRCGSADDGPHEVVAPALGLS